MKRLDIKSLSEDLRNNVKAMVDTFDPENKPTLAIIQVGHNPASDIYVRNKIKACIQAGIRVQKIGFPEDVTTIEILSELDRLNNSEYIHGILIQLPLPKHIDEKLLIENINPLKDVDGFTPSQSSKIYLNEEEHRLIPCTAKGIIKILEHFTSLEGKNITVIGRSNIVGKPVAALLTEKNATVTLCHSKSKDIEFYTRNADIIILAIGSPKYFGIKYFHTKDEDKESKFIIDVGINKDEEGKLCGDLDSHMLELFLYDKDLFYTPVPGGVGIMTITCLLENVCEAYKMQMGKY